MSDKSTLYAILVLALLLRVIGLNFGLPYIYHQDEPIIVNHAMSIGAAGWNTHFFIIPPFTIYSLFTLNVFFFLAGKFTGFFSDKVDFAVSFLRDPSLFYLLGRFFLGVLCGTATVGLVAKLGGRFFSKKIGIMAAFLLSSCVWHVQHSHYIYADIPLTFAVTALIYYQLLILNTPSFKNYIVAGLILGWAITIKYTALFFLPGMLVTHALVFRKESLSLESLKKILASGAAVLVSYAVIAPYTFIDWPHFYAQVSRQSGAESAVGVLHHLSYSILGGVGIVFTLLALLGVFISWKGYAKQATVLLSCVLFYYLINTMFSQPFARYMLPILPVLSILAAFGWNRLAEKLSGRPLLRVALMSLIAITLLFPAIYLDILFVKKDTRTQCLEWVEKEIRQGAVIVMDSRFFGPHLTQTTAQIEEKYALLRQDPKEAAKKKRLDLLLEAIGDKKTYTIYTLAYHGEEEAALFLFERPFVKAEWSKLEKIGADYLVIYYTEKMEESQQFKDSLKDRLELQATFSPYRDPAQKFTIDKYSSTAAPHLVKDLMSRERLGPYLEIYKIKHS